MPELPTTGGAWNRVSRCRYDQGAEAKAGTSGLFPLLGRSALSMA